MWGGSGDKNQCQVGSEPKHRPGTGTQGRSKHKGRQMNKKKKKVGNKAAKKMRGSLKLVLLIKFINNSSEAF